MSHQANKPSEHSQGHSHSQSNKCALHAARPWLGQRVPTVLLFAVGAGAIALAMVLARTARSGLDTPPPTSHLVDQGNARSRIASPQLQAAITASRSWSHADWRDRLLDQEVDLQPPGISRGKTLGPVLALLPGDDGLQIARDNWPHMHPVVKRDILSALLPWFAVRPVPYTPWRDDAHNPHTNPIHPLFFEFQLLGVNDRDTPVATQARRNIVMVTLLDESQLQTADGVERFSHSIEGMDAADAVRVLVRMFIERAHALDEPDDIALAAQTLADARWAMDQFPLMRDTAHEAELGALIKRWSESDWLVPAAPAIVAHTSALHDPSSPASRVAWRRANIFVERYPQQISQINLEDDVQIPLYIGRIEATDSYVGVHQIDRALSALADIEPSPLHDGAWWRRWWDANRQYMSSEAQSTPIPVLAKGEYSREHMMFPEDMDTLDGTLRWIRAAFQGSEPLSPHIARHLRNDLTARADPASIPTLIAITEAEKHGRFHHIAVTVLAAIAGTDPRMQQPERGLDWRGWWVKHKDQFSPDIAAMTIPDLRDDSER